MQKLFQISPRALATLADARAQFEVAQLRLRSEINAIAAAYELPGIPIGFDVEHCSLICEVEASVEASAPPVDELAEFTGPQLVTD